MREVRARLGCAALTLTLLLNLFPATAQAINSEYCPDGEPCTHEAAIGTTHYDTLEEAVSAAKAYQTITMRNHVELSAQIKIPDHVTLNGRGRTISVESEHWSSANPGKYLLVCGDGVTIHDVTLDGEGVASGLQFFQASKGRLEGFVTLKNAKELGLNINASQVTMDGVLTMKGNGWGNVINVGWGSIVSGMDRSSFDGSDAVLEGVTAIYTDHSDVKNAGGDERKFSIRVPDSFAAATKEELSALGKAILYAPAVAQTQGTGYLSLAGAFQAAQDDGTITLLASSAGNQTIHLADGRKLTLDLSGFQVGFAQGQTLRISHGDLTLTVQGKLYEQQSQDAPVTLWGSDDPDTEANTALTVGKDVTLEGRYGLWIGPGEEGQKACGVSARIYGTVKSTASPSDGGSALYLSETAWAEEGNVPKILLDGATLTALGGTGIYLGGYAQTTVTDSAVNAAQGGTGIVLSAGDLSIHGDTVVTGGTGSFDAEPGGDGSALEHVALAVVQHPDQLPVSLTVTGGTFTGGGALLEQNTQSGEPEATAKIQLSITGGRFHGPIYSENKTGFVSGGTFTAHPGPYLADGFAVEDSGDPIYHYMVTAAGENPAQVVTGETEVSVSDAVTNTEEQELAQQVAEALKDPQQGGWEQPHIGEALLAAASTVANQNPVTPEQGKEELDSAGIPSDDVTIVVRPYLEISVADVSIRDSAQTVTLDITPKYITVAATDPEDIQLDEGGKNAVQMGDPQELTITKPVTITLPLTEGFAEDGRLYVKHEKSSGKVYYYRGQVESNVLTFTNPNGFSLFHYSTNSDVVADVNGQGFVSLDEAIGAVEEGGTIELLAQDLSAVVARNIRFTVTGTGADTVQLTAGPGYEKKQTGNTYFFIYMGDGSDGSGGSEAEGYPIQVVSGENGTVTVSSDRANPGDTVTITVKPDAGYALDQLTVMDQNSHSVTLTDQGEETYTFTMPEGKVTVEATFQAAKEESPVNVFLDIDPEAWYYDGVKYAVENGLMSGTGADTFGPNTTLSRGMIAQMLYALEGKPGVSADSRFPDVSDQDWYANAASWAQSKGIITGYEDGRFGPNDSLTREQLALILYNYAKSKGYDTSAKADLNQYVDGSSTSAWAQTAMAWAVGEGLLSGRDANKLAPTGTATRAEVAQIMMNFCENTAK